MICCALDQSVHLWIRTRNECLDIAWPDFPCSIKRVGGMQRKHKRGDLLIYKKQKQSRKPGPRAHSVAAAVQNGLFSYVVDKFWIVEEIHEDGTLEVRTPRGKRHKLDPDDPNVRRATWWQRLRHRSLYRKLMQGADQA